MLISDTVLTSEGLTIILHTITTIIQSSKALTYLVTSSVNDTKNLKITSVR